jgi:hypothetical protein
MTTLAEMLTPALSSSAITFLARLALNVFFTTLVVRYVYYRLYRNRDYTFTYFLINLITFSITYLFSKVPIELGFALGLFAVFGILRYRTEAILVRNLTYMFVVIGLALLNALANGRITFAELVITNAVIIATVAWLEAASFSGREETRLIYYDRLDLLAPDARMELIADLRQRTHLPVERVEIGNVDLLRDCADVVIHYRSSKPLRAAETEAKVSKLGAKAKQAIEASTDWH